MCQNNILEIEKGLSLGNTLAWKLVIADINYKLIQLPLVKQSGL